jgi:hypothetical protein
MKKVTFDSQSYLTIEYWHPPPGKSVPEDTES